MRNFLGKKFAIKIYNKIQIELLKRKAKRAYPNFDNYIFKLWAQNFGFALELHCLKRLEDLCQKIRPELIFEFGSGVSTVVLAKYAQDHDCKIFTFDEEFKYLKQAYNNIRRRYPTDKMTFIYAPKNYKDFLENLEVNKVVDLLIIDGPTGDRYNEAAKNFYYKIISPQTICVIDDTDREETNEEAEKIAKINSLKKVDYKDAFYSANHQYSILFPRKIRTTQIQNNKYL